MLTSISGTTLPMVIQSKSMKSMSTTSGCRGRALLSHAGAHCLKSAVYLTSTGLITLKVANYQLLCRTMQSITQNTTCTKKIDLWTRKVSKFCVKRPMVTVVPCLVPQVGGPRINLPVKAKVGNVVREKVIMSTWRAYLNLKKMSLIMSVMWIPWNCMRSNDLI